MGTIFSFEKLKNNVHHSIHDKWALRIHWGSFLFNALSESSQIQSKNLLWIDIASHTRKYLDHLVIHFTWGGHETFCSNYSTTNPLKRWKNLAIISSSIPEKKHTHSKVILISIWTEKINFFLFLLKNVNYWVSEILILLLFPILQKFHSFYSLEWNLMRWTWPKPNTKLENIPNISGWEFWLSYFS